MRTRVMLLLLLLVTSAHAQAPAVQSAWKEFSIGPATRNATRFGPDGLRAEGIPFRRAVARAYGIPEYLVFGPQWMDEQRYAITAVVSNRVDFQPLFQKELAERFHLKAHREPKELAAYVIRKQDGVPHRLKPPSGAGASISNADMQLPSTTMPDFASALADTLSTPVIDETGISGRFGITLAWDRTKPESLLPAVQDQLGLQLSAEKRMAEVLVVDQADRLDFSPAAGDPDLSGAWQGSMQVDAETVRFVLHLFKGSGLYLGSIENLDQPAMSGLVPNAIVFSQSRLTFSGSEMGITGSYSGVLGPDGAIAGTWTQQGRAFPLAWKRAPDSATQVVARSNFNGNWQADLEIGGLGALWLVFHIETAGNGNRATLDSPDQDASGARANQVQIDGPAVTIVWRDLDAVFKGWMNREHTAIDGRFVQGDVDARLILTAVKNGSELRRNRPQTPVKPYPYREERVQYPNSKAGIRIGATLTLPPGNGPFPAVVLIAGSGALDRDEEVNGHKLFLVLADHLTRNGIAVLRADKRGVGESTGKFTDALTTDFASDVEAGLTFLKSRGEIDPRRIGLVGHSEGGVIAPIVAAAKPDVAFIVLLAGTGLPGDVFAAEQYRTNIEALGVKPAAAFAASAQMLPLFSALKLARNPNALNVALRAELGRDPSPSEVQALNRLRSPWLQGFIAIDPADALRKVTCPVLALNGSKDKQVLPESNLREIREALRAGGNTRAEVEELPGLNHLFQTAVTGSPVEYGHIEETFAPAAMEKILAWIRRTTADPVR